MGHRSRFVVGSLAGAALIHVVLVACSARGPSGGPPVGGDAAGFADAVAAGDLGRAVDAASDAAAHLADAAVDALADVGRAETPDARAGGPPMDLACNVTTVQRIVSGGSTTVFTTYYASVATALSPRDAPDVRAVVCDPVEDTNPCRLYAGSPGVTCELSGFVTGATTCSQAAVVFDGGRALVPCGSVVQTTGATTTTSGFHYRRAFVSLP